MKRNKLNTPSLGHRLFSDSGVKNKNFLFLSVLTVIFVFITTIVLATSRPGTASVESTIIDLPNLPSQQQEVSLASIKPDTTGAPYMANPLTVPQIKPDTSHAVVTSQKNHTVLDTDVAETELTANTFTEKISAAEKTNVKSKPEIKWQEITVKYGDNLSLIFPRVGLTARDVYLVSRIGKKINPLLNLKPGQILRFSISEKDGVKTLTKLQLILSPIKTFEVFSTEEGYDTNTLLREYDEHQIVTSGIIENSLFESGLKAGLSNKLVMELAHIFGWDIDFALDLRKGDQFKVVYTENYLDGKKISDGVIQAAEFTNHGKTYRAIRYTDKKGESHYFSPNGESMRKAFSRTPVKFTRISSRFSLGRKHPLLNKIRAHKGVDYAAPRGTPIMATGDGKISFVGWKGGYGRVVIISHAGKYSTLYGHMSRFRKGLKRGKRIKQGDIIGYVGMSGLATGPHLHYEFRINGVHRNPLTVKLPKAQALPKQYMADFKKKASPLLAQLDSLSPSTVALK